MILFSSALGQKKLNILYKNGQDMQTFMNKGTHKSIQTYNYYIDWLLPLAKKSRSYKTQTHTHTQTYGDNCLGLKMLSTKKKYKFLEINSFGPNVGLIFSSEATL